MPLWRFTVMCVLALAAGGAGYWLGTRDAAPEVAAPAAATPVPGSVRVIYSLDRKRNDREIIALIDAARSHIYFAMYEFTLRDVADALVAARRRGVEVRGLVDAGESAKPYAAPVIAELRDAGIPIETQRHADGNGIMHIKAIVTESAYALGSYNWTASATAENDELLEIGTDPALVNTYAALLLRLLAVYQGNTPAPSAAPATSATYDYTEASGHVGEYAAVRGTLVRAHVSGSGTVFLDFCSSYRSCPFAGVIFADDAAAFGDLSRYAGRSITLTGTISSYRGRAEIKLSDPAQISATVR
ncbi:MAG: hypothetical protein KGJ55_01410 [Gammaproteobacteria bacterium]|nr:hypothetical protein [Gammaproteobacteria bacterium]